MIDKSKKYWTGDSAEDIDEYLRLYSEDEGIDVKSVRCHSCGSDSFEIKVDQNEAVIQIKCTECGAEKTLLDCEEFLEDAKPKWKKCPVCKKSKAYNVKVGFTRRENGSAKWVYIGNRCTGCQTLGSYLDWPIDYEPTDEMEKNI